MTRDLDRISIPKIDMARSAAKRLFESVVVTRGVIRKLRSTGILEKHHRIGVVGLSAVGRRLVEELVRGGKDVRTYDKFKGLSVGGAVGCDRLSALFTPSTLVFGCTGKNWLTTRRLDALEANGKLLVSCSSRQVEFLDLLQFGIVQKGQTAYETLRVEYGRSSSYTVANGGFPINFDREVEWEHESEIILTRCLMLLAIYQAVNLNSHCGGVTLRLDPVGQRSVVDDWLKAERASLQEFGIRPADFESIEWWRRNSMAVESHLS